MRLKNPIIYSALLLALSGVAVYERAAATADPAPAAGCSFQSGAVALLAATATVAGKPEVRLRWMTTRGWVPGVAFNLYRFSPDQKREKLNVEPLGGKGDGPQRRAISERTPNPRMSNEFQYADTLDVARVTLPLTALQTVVKPVAIERMDSEQAFRERRDTVKQLRVQQANGPAVPRAPIPNQIVKADDYVETIRNGTIARAGNRRTATGHEKILAARSSLQLAAMVHPQIANDLGFTFDDKTAQAGVLYTYELRSIESGQECATAVASIQFSVGTNASVPSVAHLTAAQADENSVDLRWSRPANEDALVPTYRIKRVDSRGRSHLTTQPIMIADIPLDTPTLSNNRMVTHVEPRSFYHDRGVAPGIVTYTVVMTDIFGRESAPASIVFTMEDWHTPKQVARVWAELNSRGNVLVSWTPSATESVVYRVYRQDEENPKAGPVLLTTLNPIAGTQVSMPDELNALLNPRRAAQSITTPDNAGRPESSPASATRWLAYTDMNVPNDHTYRYFVTAVYQNRNNLNSAASYSRVLPVPVTTLLAGPANLKFNLLPAAPARGNANKWEIRPEPPRERNIGGVIQLTWDKVPGAKLYRVYRANASGYFHAASKGFLPGQLIVSPNVVNPAGIQVPTTIPGAVSPPAETASKSPATPSVIAIPNIGANVTTQVAPANPNLRANVTTQVAPANPNLRANVTTPVAPAIPNIGANVTTQVAPANPNIGANVMTAVATGTPNIAVITPFATTSPNVGRSLNPRLSLKDIEIKGGMLRYLNEIDDGNLPDSSYALVGQVNDTGVFYDYYPRSQAHTYAYRVVAVNRWNVPAPGMVKDANYSSTRVRVPATLPPSTPVLLSVTSDKDGYLELKIQGNLENQGVVRYQIYRRDLTLRFDPAALVVSMPQNTGPVLAGSITVVHPVALGQVAPISTPFRERHAGYEKIAGFPVPKGKITSGDPLTFRDKTVFPFHKYFYYVVAHNTDPSTHTPNGNESKPSNILHGIPLHVRAAAPTSLVASLGRANEVRLSWPITLPKAVYLVERAQGESTNFVQLSGASSKPSYTDYSALPGRTYVYRVIAVEESGVISDPYAYPLDQDNKRPDAYPARVTFKVQRARGNQ